MSQKLLAINGIFLPSQLKLILLIIKTISHYIRTLYIRFTYLNYFNNVSLKQILTNKH